MKNGKEYVIHLTDLPAFTGIPESFLAQIPSHCYLEYITDSNFVRFDRESLNQLMDQDHSIERFVRKAATEVLVGIFRTLLRPDVTAYERAFYYIYEV